MSGVGGVGKTTLCRETARRSGAARTEIDAFLHGPDWTPRPEGVARGHLAAPARIEWLGQDPGT